MASYLRRDNTFIYFPVPPIITSQMELKSRRAVTQAIAGNWLVVEFPNSSIKWELQLTKIPESLAERLRQFIDTGGVVRFDPGDGVERTCVFGNDNQFEPMVSYHPVIGRNGGPIPDSVKWWKVRLQLLELLQ